MVDCLGTLVRLEPPAPRLRAELARRGIEVSHREADAAFRAEIDYYLAHHVEAADAARLERLRAGCARVLAESLGTAPEQLEAVRGAMLAALAFSPFPDTTPALRALRAAGIRVVVASNWDCSLAAVLERCRLDSLVDGVVTSAQVGAAKPAPAVVEAALALAGRGPESALLVGDSIVNDLGAARAVGLPAILLERAGRSAPGEASAPRARGDPLAWAPDLLAAAEAILAAPGDA